MIEAYFDESGIHNGAKMCVVAGYFGHSAQWRAFTKKWLAVLERFDFPLNQFHATKLISSKTHEPMIRALAHAIGQSQIYPVSSGIIVKDFLSFTFKQRQFFTGATAFPGGKLKSNSSPNEPYFVPFQKALENITSYTRPGRTAKLYFGLDRDMAGFAKAFFKQIRNAPWRGSGWKTRNRLGDISFPLAKETPALQAADLLSFLSYRYMNERLEANDWKIQTKPPLSTCLRNIRSEHDHGFEAKDSLQFALDRSYEVLGNWDG